MLKLPLDMLYHWEKTTPNAVYLRQPINGVYQEYSWAQTAKMARSLATALQQLNMPKGAKVAIWSKNCAEWIMADLAIMMAGYVSVPIYFTAKAQTIAYVLEHSESQAIFIGKLDNLHEGLPAIAPHITRLAFPYENVPMATTWAQMLAQPPMKGEPQREAQEVMSLVYTSGSTGKPKGVVDTFFAYASACAAFERVIPATNKERVMSYLPLAHITERVVVEGGSFYKGYSLSFVESLDSFQANVKAVQPTMFLPVPRLWTRFQMGILAKLPQKKLDLLLSIPLVKTLVARKIRRELGLDSATVFGSGSAPLSAATIRWYQRLGIRICEGWGMSESNGLGTVNFPFRDDKVGSIGRPQNPQGVRISEEGEIQVKGDNLMKEYYKDPEQTAAAYTDDGWFKTGDKGSIDSEGYIRITGRLKEIFKTAKGKYVAPVPIEALLMENSFIEQVCVTGSNLKQPIALVVLAPEAHQLERAQLSASLEHTLDAVNARLESHELLDALVIVKDSWSAENGLLTPTLKIKRSEVENAYQALINQAHSQRIQFA
jgi:long-subunit acyl-CoA synthetase (AMP-forming)